MGHAAVTLRIVPDEIERAVAGLYVRSLQSLPPDVEGAIGGLRNAESDDTARQILDAMLDNIAVAARTGGLLCQDTGLPVVTVSVGRGVVFDGIAVEAAIRRGVARATREHPLRSSVVHPLTRANDQDSTGIRIPAIHWQFVETPDWLRLDFVPKGSGSENGSFLAMLLPADGIAGIKRFVIDKVVEAGGKVCPPTVVGVGIGGTSDLCMHLAKVAATRPLGTVSADEHGRALEVELGRAVNRLGIGPQGLGGDATAYAVHVEVAATHITLNPVAVNIQCHSARRASATFTAAGIEVGA